MALWESGICLTSVLLISLQIPPLPLCCYRRPNRGCRELFCSIIHDIVPFILHSYFNNLLDLHAITIAFHINPNYMAYQAMYFFKTNHGYRPSEADTAPLPPHSCPPPHRGCRVLPLAHSNENSPV